MRPLVAFGRCLCSLVGRGARADNATFFRRSPSVLQNINPRSAGKQQEQHENSAATQGRRHLAIDGTTLENSCRDKPRQFFQRHSEFFSPRGICRCKAYTTIFSIHELRCTAEECYAYTCTSRPFQVLDCPPRRIFLARINPASPGNHRSASGAHGRKLPRGSQRLLVKANRRATQPGKTAT